MKLALNPSIPLGDAFAFLQDPKKNEFLGDEQANRLRGEAAREPWRTY